MRLLKILEDAPRNDVVFICQGLFFPIIFVKLYFKYTGKEIISSLRSGEVFPFQPPPQKKNNLLRNTYISRPQYEKERKSNYVRKFRNICQVAAAYRFCLFSPRRSFHPYLGNIALSKPCQRFHHPFEQPNSTKQIFYFYSHSCYSPPPLHNPYRIGKGSVLFVVQEFLQKI